jgi:cation diffusion facilitator CzcD-associated flavoprotein CzcO
MYVHTWNPYFWHMQRYANLYCNRKKKGVGIPAIKTQKPIEKTHMGKIILEYLVFCWEKLGKAWKIEMWQQTTAHI